MKKIDSPTHSRRGGPFEVIPDDFSQPIFRAILGLVAVVSAARAARIVVYCYDSIAHVTHRFFWDFETMYVAAIAHQRGLNPYNMDVLKGLDSQLMVSFVYPPITLPLLHPLVWLPFGAATAINAGVICASLAAIFAAQVSAFRITTERAFYFIGFVVLLNLASFDSVTTGNIAAVFHALLSFGLLAFVRGRRFWFYAAVFVVCSFKIHFAALLLFPLLLDFRANIFAAALTSGFVAVEYGFMQMGDPAAFAAFMTSAGKVCSHPDYDCGDGVLGFAMMALNLVRTTSGLKVPDWAIFALWGALVAIILLAGWRISSSHARYGVSCRPELVAFFFLTAFLAVPRLKPYDVAALNVPLLLLIERYFLPYETKVNWGLIAFLLVIFPSPLKAVNLTTSFALSHWSFLAVFVVWLGSFLVLVHRPIDGENILDGRRTAAPT